MRTLLSILLFSFLGCASNTPEYSPETFQDDLAKLVAKKRYRTAIKYLAAADPAQQAEFDNAGFYAVGQDMIVLPGMPDTEHYDRNRDWMFPHTSDAIRHMGWQRAATRFAEKYNISRLAR